MKGIDALLAILVRQQATELRLGSGQPPRLFRAAEELPLTMPATSADALKTLLGDVISNHQSALSERGSASFVHRSSEAGDFDVSVNRRAGSDAAQLDVRFVRRTGEEPRVREKATPRPTHAADEIAPPLVAVLSAAASLGASDVHLTEGRSPIVRVDGELRLLENVETPDVTSLLRDEAKLERVRAGRSADIGLDLPGIGRLRVNVYATGDGLAAAIRLLRRDAPPLADLNLPAVTRSLVDLPHGLVIACGPTGSGKSTTLAALAREALARRPRLLITLEDPLEYRIPAMTEGSLVRQREIGPHLSDFATGLRDALREDPDILLVGEMRDPETISLAITAAETGHLVLTTLHSRTSSSAIERIVDTYPPERQRQIRVQLADSLRAVISQRLLPRADGGRVVACEFLRVNHAVAHLIRDGRTPQILNALQSGRDEGMEPLERNLGDLVRREIVTLEAARAVAGDPKALDEYLRAARPKPSDT